jgi:hypothetical protein
MIRRNPSDLKGKTRRKGKKAIHAKESPERRWDARG